MKKKLCSVITMFAILFACVFVSACGDKYKNMEFRIWYACSADAQEWHDGSDGISINYDPNNIDDGEGDNNSLLFDDKGVGTLYLKIEVLNVKAKDVDSITVSFASLTGLNFSSQRVLQNQVFTVPVTGNVDTTLKLYENNSNKKKEAPFVVSRKLEKIEAVDSIMPAIASTVDAQLNLASLGNLEYYPLHQTNQLGAIYSIEGIGCYNAGTFNKVVSAEEANEYATIEGGKLRIVDGSFFTSVANAYIFRIKATSVHYAEMEELDANYYDYFDVYVVSGNVGQPIAKYRDENDGQKVSEINIYENGGAKYSTSTIYIDDANIANDKYYAGLNTLSGVAKFNTVFYVENAYGVYERYNFGSAQHQGGINGLLIENNLTLETLAHNEYRFSIIDRNKSNNKVKVVYEIEGINVEFANIVCQSYEFYVHKSVVPTCITINDALDLNSASPVQNAVVYGTKSESYKGLELKLSVNPNEDPNSAISFENLNLIIVDDRGMPVTSVTTGKTIYIKFKNSVIDAQNLTFKTLKVPARYNGKDILTSIDMTDDRNFIVAQYNLTKVVTADAFEFLTSKTGTATNSLSIDAENNSEIFVKVYYDGYNLDAASVVIKSLNDQISFANGSSVVALNDSNVAFVDSNTDAAGKYNIYAVKVKAPQGVFNSRFVITAGEGHVGVEKGVDVQSVYLMQSLSGISVSSPSSTVTKFTTSQVDNDSYNFAVPRNERAELIVKDGAGNTKTIAGIKIKSVDVSGEEFSTSAISFNVVSNSTFEIVGKVSGKTQVLDLEISYYAEVDGAIQLKTVTKKVQVAVFDGVGNITSSVTSSMVGYVNPYFTETSVSTIKFDSYTSNYGTPANYVEFAKFNEGAFAEKIKVDHASQIEISISNREVLRNSHAASILYLYGSNEIDLLNTNTNVVIQDNLGEDILNGKIEVKLTDALTSVNEISLTISALRFGNRSNVIKNVVIKVADVDRAERIVVSGNNFIQTGDTSNELRLSFIDVVDGGYDEAEFNADLQFAGPAEVGSLRFDDIETALTHILYEYITDDNGNTTINRIQNDFLRVSYLDGKINVKAEKRLGGGIFKLVLVAKDSYNLLDDPNSIVLKEEYFDTKYSIVVRVSDGEIGSEYIIEKPEDMSLINYNLRSNFVLGANIDLTSTKFAPIGLVGNGLTPFDGSLNGSLVTFGEEDIKLVFNYSITFNVDSSVESTEYGIIYGLIAILGENGKVLNLKLNAVFDKSLENKSVETGTKIGSVAGVNKGLIENVSVVVLANANKQVKLDAIEKGDSVDFGVIVGVNEAEIANSKVECSELIYITANQAKDYNIGLIAGNNAGTISGSYLGKESLNDYVYDVIANLHVLHSSNSNIGEYCVGSVAGVNTGTISNFLVGGKINLASIAITTPTGILTQQTGYLGGLVGSSNGGNVETVTALSLDLTANANDVNVAGIVGKTNETEVKNVKYISVITKFNSFTSLGEIKGENLVAGIIASASRGYIKYASVESFVQVKDDNTFYAISGKISAGLIAVNSSTSVSQSFANANIKASDKIILTSETNEVDTYFIGKASGTANVENKTTYSIVDGVIKLGLTQKTINWSEIMVVDATINAETKEWKNIYTTNGTDYFEATEFTGDTYYKFNVEKWLEFVEVLKPASNDNWEIKEDYNVVKFNGVSLFFPYLLRKYVVESENKSEPLMIVAPQSISASLDQEYISDVSSVYIKEFILEEYLGKISEAVIVNYYNGAGDEGNAYKLIGTKNEDGDDLDDGLLDVDILPEDAQGLYMFDIIGTGRNYAYINNKKEIVFTGVSGSTPIIVRIYSGFNPDIEVYVAIYTQSLLTNFKLNANSIYYSNSVNYDYEINAYSGQSNIIISVDAENKLNGSSYTNVLEVYNLSKYLSVEAVSDATDSKLILDASAYNNITLRIKDEAVVDFNYSELITFRLMLDKEYFAIQTKDGAIYPIDEIIPLAEVKLNVHLYNSAKSIQVIGEDEEKTTHDDISFDVYLTTDYVDKTASEDVEEELLIDENGEIYLGNSLQHDSIIITLDVVSGEEEKDGLLAANGLTHFAELFLEESSVVRSFMRTAAPENKIIGYVYKVRLELKNAHTYRYIQNNIQFNISVTATSNASINTKQNSIEITMKPTMLSTLRIENYAVKTLNVNTDYTNIVTNDKIETSVVEPGSLGNVMLIYLEPTYSNVVAGSVTVKAAPLYVPSLGRHVQMKFTQLVHDQRKGGKGYFTTLYGEDTTVQDGDTLKLKLISNVDENGIKTYNGVICLYIQFERFVGVDEKINVQVSAQTKSGNEITTVERNRELMVTYLPGAELKYDSEKKISDGYLIQKGTYSNNVDVKIFGYQFNSNPTVKFEWVLPEDSDYNYVVEDGVENLQIIYKDINGDGTISSNENFLIGDYVSYVLNKNYDEVIYNPEDKSYTIGLAINVSENIMASFRVSASLELVTKDGQIKSVDDELNKLTFYPAEYIVDSVSVKGLTNGRKNIAINTNSDIDLIFTTDNDNNDLSEMILKDLLTYATGENGKVDKAKIASRFSYYKNGVITFADDALHPEFEFNLVNNSKFAILGISSFNYVVEFNIWYGYVKAGNGTYQLKFGEYGDADMTSSLSHRFTLNIDSIGEENEIPIYGADDIYNSTNGTWKLVEGMNYILMNDIELENVVPITTKIARFDGNNRVISIKNFAVNSSSESFGLFGTIGTYTTQDFVTEQQVTKQTVLRNVIVDYSKFNGTLALNENTASEISVGGLVGVNDGGLIYNCDVINLNAASNGIFGLIVANDANVTFGGLVGINNGVITNSRVGRSSYTRIEATQTTESTVDKYLGPLTFEIYNSKNIDDKNNKFSSVVGGFVGENTGTIATSFVSRTNVVNYSTNEQKNMTSGFVGINSGKVEFSYVGADSSTLSASNPYSTGFVIENKGNGIVSGFVYSNNGTISNSYVNTELQTKSAYIAGFVYENSGSISECYAAATMNSGDTDNNAEQPFVGVDNAGKLLSFGTLENTYYLMRSDSDTPFYDGEKDVAEALNLDNFQKEENLVGFSFVLSNIKYEREQGIWSYYSIENRKRLLPELMNANKIAHSYRFIVENNKQEKVLVSATSFVAGLENNPFTIGSVEDYNKVFAANNKLNSQTGYIRFINNIDFGNEGNAIRTRSNYTLGSDIASTRTSVEGNGMTISGIYIDVDDVVISKVGMFAEIKNAYIKNMNLKFATPTANGQFSTTTATYSGGLAGKITDSVVLNISLEGNDTTLTGSNFVGGLAGHISGKSLVYGIDTNLNVKAGATESYLYYTAKEYNALNIGSQNGLSYDQYLTRLSYAGGVAGVLDLETKNETKYNLQFIDIYGDRMNIKTFEGVSEANIMAEYAGGVAGYAGRQTNAFKLKYHTGTAEFIQGDSAVGGLFAVSLGNILASQVTANEDRQYVYDTEMGKYIATLEAEKDLAIDDEKRTNLDTTKVGNTQLLKGHGYVGGMVGVGLDVKIQSSYSKVGIVSGKVVGGLIGVSVASNISYSYSIPYINSYSAYQYVGGLVGASYGITASYPTRNEEVAEYEALLKYYKVSNQSTDVVCTFSTLITDVANFEKVASAKYDYICADYTDTQKGHHYIQSSGYANFVSVYSGIISDASIVSNNTEKTNKASIAELYKMYKVGDPEQKILFNNIFTGWSIEPYWSLNNEKYFPLLINKRAGNYIEIRSASDLEFIRQNPNGNFLLVNPIEVTCEKNWVIAETFKGTFSGYTDNDVRPTITIKTLAPDISNETCGFFQKTENAKIAGIEIVYKQPIVMNNVTDLTMVAGLTCNDEKSQISNVQVRADGSATEYIINESSKTIGGFGGIVGVGKQTDIMNCNFTGKVNAVLKDSTDGAFVGGIVGNLDGGSDDPDSAEFGSAVVTNSTIGASKPEVTLPNDTTIKYPATKFNLSISADADTSAAVYVGGLVGIMSNGGIAASKVGGATNENVDYKYVDINIQIPKIDKYIYVGGSVGHANQGPITNNDILTNITAKTEDSPFTDATEINIGGIAGSYNLGAVATLTKGISSCSVDANIKTEGVFTNATLLLSNGVATMGGSPEVVQCLFKGTISTETATVSTLYAGGAVAHMSEDGKLKISEVITNTEIYAQSTDLFVGGLVGHTESNTSISYSASWGRIVPITASATNLYAGGVVGYVDKGKVSLNNSYTISSIVADSITGSAITQANLGAVAGTTGNIESNIFFYSTDYALCTDQNEVGKNYSAVTMIRDNSWHSDLKTEGGTQNGIWTSLRVGGRDMLPFLSSLELKIKEYGLIIKADGASYEDYALGSAMNPELIYTGTNIGFKTEYTYYIVVTSGSTNNTFTISPSGEQTAYLNGVLIGLDEKLNYVGMNNAGADDDFGVDVEYQGVVPAVLKHSAVSNLHIEIAKGEYDVAQVAGVIAGINNGVIFNSSVHGNGIELKNTSAMGLIAGRNKGLISSSYSSAEIIKAGNVLAGIVHTNGGRLIHNYFTGYIGSSACGILIEEDNSNLPEDNPNLPYVYNNYVGGVINSPAGANRFAGSTITGKNNFIDSYSDVQYDDKNPDPAIEAVSTADLMAGKNLEGYWYKTTIDGIIDTSCGSFGRNFNYPVHQFNKFKNVSGTEVNIDKVNVVDTGFGGSYNNLSDPSAEILSVEERYAIIHSDEDTYNNAIKIPHFGVLTSIQALIGESRDYVLIYDLNGFIIDNTYKEMLSIGTKGTVNGFKNPNPDLGEKTLGFQGVFVTNKYLARQEDMSQPESLCVIEKFSKEGLFTNIYDAYFGDIIFGSFNSMDASGPLGKVVLSGNVSVNNVSYKTEEQVVISALYEEGKDDASYSGLFGTIETDATVSILQFSSEGLLLDGEHNSIVGLFAATLKGKISFDANNANKMVASFVGNKIAGGVAGLMDGGTVIGKGNTININKVDSTEYIYILGGVVGETITADCTIDNIGVRFYSKDEASTASTSGTGESLTIYANNFGGIVGVVNSKVVMTGTIAIHIKEKSVTFVNSDDASQPQNFYGLIAGIQNKKIEAETFEIDDTENSNGYLQINVKSLTPNYDDNSTKHGVGVFVGQQNEDLVVTEYRKTSPKVLLTAKGVPNVGSIAGLYSTGAVNIGGIISADPTATDVERFYVVGTTNVGGLYGFFNGDLTSAFSADKSLLSSSQGYAIVVADGSDVENQYKNVGGLFGKWQASVDSASVASTASDPDAELELHNSNKIYIGLSNTTGYKLEEVGGVLTLTAEINPIDKIERYVFNVGGIAGWFGGSVTTPMTNSGIIQTWNNQSFDDHQIKNVDSNDGDKIVKATNVGGIFGFIDAGSDVGKIKNKAGNIIGYQNVGGIVGYAEGGEVTNIENVLEDFAIDSSSGEITEPKANTDTKGNIIGVVNVGGVAGYAGKQVTITGVYSTANVKGNVNVGGLVGISEDANLTNNYIWGQETDATKTGAVTGVVTGIYYNIYINSLSTYSYIPTSVGGLVGLAGGTGENAQIQNNILNGVIVTSAEEIADVAKTVVSRTDNYIAVSEPTITHPGESDIATLTNFNSSAKTYQYPTAKIAFGDIKTGFGGLFGTITASVLTCTSSDVSVGDDGSTASLSSTGSADRGLNILRDIKIKASLGVNVGAFYGAYKPDIVIKLSAKNVLLIAPKSFETIAVDGAYNVGGVVGFVNDSSSSGHKGSYNISNADFEGDATISLQSNMTGMYVGGLIGRTNSNLIGDGSTTCLSITDTFRDNDHKVSIKIDTSKSYYIGGVIGKAEVNKDATLYLKNSTTKLVEGSDFKDFGGVIGILKVNSYNQHPGVSINVAAMHDFPFTINTIENGNYHEGVSTFNIRENSSNALELYAQAYYINLDHFSISVSSDVPTNNPLDSKAEGWHKDYTIAKTIQRCIPASENKNMWDSIAVIYDAEHIKGVKTASDGKIEHTIYEEEDGQPKVYKADGIYTALLDLEGAIYEADVWENVPEKERWQWYIDNDVDLTKDGSGKNEFSIGDLNDQFRSIISALGLTKVPDPNGIKENWIVPFRYNNVDYMFIKSKNFTDENGIQQDDGSEHSTSGSIFEVNGFAKTTPDSNIDKMPDEKFQEDHSWLWYVGAAVITVIAAAVSIIVTVKTGGVAGAGAWKGFTIIMNVVWGVVKTVGFASFIIANMIVLATTEKMVQNYNTQVFYLNSVKQSDGFLSSVYSREIKYQSGKVMGDVDDIDDFTGFVYQPISTEKPIDYVERKYALYQCTTSGDIATKTQNGVLTYAGNLDGYTYSDSNTSTPEIDGFKLDGGAEETYYVVEKGSEKYVVVDNYIFKEGQYWINTTAASIAQSPTSDLFVVPTVTVAGTETELESHAYYMEDGAVYIHGKLDRDEGKQMEYSFAQNYDNYVTEFNSNKTEATVTYDTKEYTITKDITKKVPLKYAYAEQQNASKYTAEMIKDYSYIQGAYYTTSGYHMHDSSNKEIVKYATYKYSATKPDGYEGYDYLKNVVVDDDDGSETYYYHTLDSISATGTAQAFYADNPESDIVAKIYPGTFKNPYKFAQDLTISEQISKGIRDEAYYTVSDSGIEVRVEYFLYIGGFKAELNGDDVDVYIPTEDTNITLYQAGGTHQEFMLSKIFDMSDSEKKNYYITSVTDDTGITVEEYLTSYKKDGDQYYVKNAYFSISKAGEYEEGLLVRNDLYYEYINRDLYNRGKYLTSDIHGLYTRYKYDDNYTWIENGNGKWVIGEDEEQETFSLIPENYYKDFNGWPNSRTTYLVEAVKVALSGNASNTLYPSVDDTSTTLRNCGSVSSIDPLA